jgi:hypothetical protein
MLTLSSYRERELAAMAGKHALEDSLLRTSTGSAFDRYVHVLFSVQDKE